VGDPIFVPRRLSIEVAVRFAASLMSGVRQPPQRFGSSEVFPLFCFAHSASIARPFPASVRLAYIGCLPGRIPRVTLHLDQEALVERLDELWRIDGIRHHVQQSQHHFLHLGFHARPQLALRDELLKRRARRPEDVFIGSWV
jgi:hypothetical protein